MGSTRPSPSPTTDHAVILRLVVGHGLDGDDVAAVLGIGIEHLRETALAVGLHQHVGQQQRERLVADQLARAPHRMAKPERLLLAREARLPGPGRSR